ncbi:MAG: D-alanyl-D-alanine carboxypeptidase [Gammaproteobacteria bacterium]|nr:D-alanyl-D-alanine carboxypeptidase [Gammaproteobacteria bacterium]MCF6259196.1 D-alanyl-D-alanine carboxypeptidase [Gammaproteobacteria bacterium]
MSTAMHRLLPFFIVILFMLFLAPVQAATLIPATPKIKAKGYLLIDFNSGRVLAEKKSDQRLEPASLTKMLSAYVIDHELAKGNISLNDEVRISEKAWRMEGSRMFIEVGKKVSVEDLLKGVIIQSGNDATVALAEHVAGSEDAFVSLMNQHAAELGMLDSHFVNSTGLPHKDHYTTPRDLAKLAIALIRDYPTHYAWYSQKEFVYNDIKQYNRNRLLWRNKYVDGIKTGHTESAGYCLVASAERDGMRLISVVLGTRNDETRSSESQKLLTYGFRFFETHRLYKANEPLTTARVWKGAQEELSLGLNEDLYLTIPKGQYKKLEANMDLDARITAPIKQGQAFGSVNISLGDEQYAKRKLIALSPIESGGLFGNLVDEIKLLFE